MGQNTYPFQLVPLPYAYNALEPYIDEKTMHLHHDAHLQTYVNNLNAVLKDHPMLHSWTLEQLLAYSDMLPEEIHTAVINNGGGVYNHNFYFANMQPHAQQTALSGNLLHAINSEFGSYDNFKAKFKQQALAVFGSGYTALVLNHNGSLEIMNTANQNTLLNEGVCLIMLIDVWEHAYYLKNYNVRANYIDNWFNVVNLSLAEKNFEKCIIMEVQNANW